MLDRRSNADHYAEPTWLSQGQLDPANLAVVTLLPHARIFAKSAGRYPWLVTCAVPDAKEEAESCKLAMSA